MSVAAEASVGQGHAWYVYGVVASDAEPPASAAGVEGDVALVDEGPVAALVSRVPLHHYGEEPVRARLEDPVWLEEKARAHDAVLEAALQSGPVVPFRFLTLYRNDAELRRFLESRGDDLRAVLDRVQGKVELGVKAFVDRERLSEAVARDSAALQQLDAEIGSAAGGKAYLLQRRREELVRAEVNRFLVGCAREAHGRLVDVADDAVLNPVQARELSGRQDEMLLNGAYLVESGAERLRETVAGLASAYEAFGILFEITGPWPPYNFVPRDLNER